LERPSTPNSRLLTQQPVTSDYEVLCTCVCIIQISVLHPCTSYTHCDKCAKVSLPREQLLVNCYSYLGMTLTNYTYQQMLSTDPW